MWLRMMIVPVFLLILGVGQISGADEAKLDNVFDDHVVLLGFAWDKDSGENLYLYLKNPTLKALEIKDIYIQEEPILEPEKDYEKEGFTPNVVYTCGVVERNEKVLVYYGCCDSVLSVATVNREDIEI